MSVGYSSSSDTSSSNGSSSSCSSCDPRPNNSNTTSNSNSNGDREEKVCCRSIRTGSIRWMPKREVESDSDLMIVDDARCKGEKTLSNKIIDYIRDHTLVIGGGVGILITLIIILMIIT